MELLAYIAVIIYGIALLLIFFYSLAQLQLLYNYLRSRKKDAAQRLLDITDHDKVPMVTVQLPVFNELYVVERLLDNIALLDYPPNKLEIQVLDDSTDETVNLISQKVAGLKAGGLDIVHLHRTNREGFKAGALKEGLKSAKGELIAIFDADFLPRPDWLKKTVPYFDDERTGVVQTRWGHLNRNYSILTRIQAFALDAHFTIEQRGRNAREHFINFNGTAGIWRRSCILDAGNWEGDTLTEDLDLSYRAQFKKWKFRYLEHVETPAELPVMISAARSQQFRWNKGGAENFQKSARRLLTTAHLPLTTRIHGLIHLLNSSMFLFAFAAAILSIPVMLAKHYIPALSDWMRLSGIFMVSTFILLTCYWFTYKNLQKGGIKGFISFVPLFITFFAVALGFSLHNSFAVIEGHLGKKSPFVRTPKFNVNENSGKKIINKYLNKRPSPNTLLECLLTLYFIGGFIIAWWLKDYAFMGFMAMLGFGFGYVCYNSITANS
ncbi:cellulose synthase family protein [Robertkochia sediminum]|uniref:cellulose synthase family protein n=1 Tax=Robertkochia sediminum TaxID=2785326 RepID=UPI0019335BEA|nr:cellulose synthase family protein [Robertkochia sediminum]MBL7473062.1 glycosyltransferase family 2 protein [Robertkochia sediminum]